MSITDLSINDKLNLKNPNKNMALAIFTIHIIHIYYTWKNIKSE